MSRSSPADVKISESALKSREQMSESKKKKLLVYCSQQHTIKVSQDNNGEEKNTETPRRR